MTRRLDYVACVVALTASTVFALASVWPLAVLEAVVATGLLVGTLQDVVWLRSTFRLVLMLQLLVFGAVWPSLLTVVAILVLPALGIAIRNLVRPRSPSFAAIYVAASGLQRAQSWVKPLCSHVDR